MSNIKQLNMQCSLLLKLWLFNKNYLFFYNYIIFSMNEFVSRTEFTWAVATLAIREAVGC